MLAAAQRPKRRAAFVSGVLIWALATTCAVSAFWAPASTTEYVNRCAFMPDSVGLYVGNPVTQMGLKIGEVQAISPGLTEVRVDFTVEENRALPADVRAVTRSLSILADRSLELVGNYTVGPQLSGQTCIPLSRATTPKSLSQIIGSATTFLDELNPDKSTNIGATVVSIDEALRGKGPAINQLLTTSSAVLDSPDQGVSDLKSILINLEQLTSTLRDISGPLKETLLATYETSPAVTDTVRGGALTFGKVNPLLVMVSDLDTYLGDEFQTVYNDLEYALRKASGHATLLADFLKPGPVIINKIENWANNKRFNIRYRPPLYRIGTPVDGLITCGAMNSAAPGSCADVAGKPYAVDVALLQYVLTVAASR